MSGRAIVGTPLTIPVVVLVRHDHEVAVAQRLDVLGRVLRAEAEAQDLDDVLDLRCDARVAKRAAPSVDSRGRADGVSLSMDNEQASSRGRVDASCRREDAIAATALRRAATAPKRPKIEEATTPVKGRRVAYRPGS